MSFPQPHVVLQEHHHAIETEIIQTQEEISRLLTTFWDTHLCTNSAHLKQRVLLNEGKFAKELSELEAVRDRR